MKKKLSIFVFVLLSAVSVFAKEVVTEHKVVNTYKTASGNLNEYRLLNSIPVYINTDVQNKVDAVYIVVEGGSVLQSPEYSGLEQSLFNMMTYGSKKYSYEQIQSMAYKMQTSVSSYTMYCGSVLRVSCINYYLDKMLPVLLDEFLNPAFNQNEYKLLMNNYEQQLQKRANDPDDILFEKIYSEIYKDSPLLTSSDVKPESIKNITIANMKKLHKEILNPERIKVVAVGPLDVDAFLEELNATLGKIPAPKKHKKTFKPVRTMNLDGEKVVLHHKNAAGEEFIVRVFATPEVTSPDYVTARIVSDIYSSTMFNIIREKYGACYTPASFIDSSFDPAGMDYGVRVSDMENFEKYLKECEALMLEGKVISSVSAEGVTYDTIENCLTGYINSYITKKYSSQCTSSGIASRITSSILQFGDVTSADKIPEMALKVTAEDVKRVFKTYWVDGKSRWFEMRGL
ncbi:pitrilysin family protein [Treponema sp.]|uniref:M16 family metallopeptidase n=1 Tax=Treponema sp. TaxID=166 RepID=UPI00298E4038|nr:pitrilysin family protein [Treponema sp.]MCR5612212.1 insulinase family protein [Treponema sp.]